MFRRDQNFKRHSKQGYESKEFGGFYKQNKIVKIAFGHKSNL